MATMETVRCYIGLGSNLNQPRKQLEQAIGQLKKLPQSHWVTCSTFHQTAPVGPVKQPDFINAVAAIDTSLDPHTLLTALQAIENAQHRTRQVRWGPRTLDLDLLLYGDHVINTPTLTVPHPEMCHRLFVIAPLLEIAPDLRLPDGKLLKSVSYALSE